MRHFTLAKKDPQNVTGNFAFLSAGVNRLRAKWEHHHTDVTPTYERHSTGLPSISSAFRRHSISSVAPDLRSEPRRFSLDRLGDRLPLFGHFGLAPAGGSDESDSTTSSFGNTGPLTVPRGPWVLYEPAVSTTPPSQHVNAKTDDGDSETIRKPTTPPISDAETHHPSEHAESCPRLPRLPSLTRMNSIPYSNTIPPYVTMQSPRSAQRFHHSAPNLLSSKTSRNEDYLETLISLLNPASSQSPEL
ncbi:hypothetical protein M231_00676 [Tremella mesenterica]|uniref:Uncharacterized protein n=1 Tax=Tremella mesenterica TaxID=5217 RepID=A0A4Q1BV22_TREME|nr:hypothetical protein M231_00676 [Tremella mesenterica]